LLLFKIAVRHCTTTSFSRSWMSWRENYLVLFIRLYWRQWLLMLGFIGVFKL